MLPHRERLDVGATPYDRMQAREGIPVYRGYFLEDVMALEVAPWERTGVRGCYLNLSHQQDTDAYVCEIPPGGATIPQQHIFEEIIYVASGGGSTSLWREGSPRLTFEWTAGAVFSIPLNVSYQHFNASGTKPVRLFAGTTCPRVLNIFRNEEFVFQNPFAFTERFEPSEEFLRLDKHIDARNWETNLVQEVNRFPLDDFPMKGKGVKHMRFTLADSSYGCHISEYPVGSRSTFHRHAPGAVVHITEGEGYVSLWRDGEEPQDHHFQAGAIYAPGDLMWHAHFNTGHGRMRHFAMRGTSPKHTFDRFRSPLHGMLPFTDEPPGVHPRYIEELARNGVTAEISVIED